MKIIKFQNSLFVFALLINMSVLMLSCGKDNPKGTDDKNTDLDPVQILLDDGKTPLELFNDNIPLSSIYGKSYEGGLIFYLNTDDGSGMVASTEDLGPSMGIAWGCYFEEVFYGATGEGVGTGTQNTVKIVSGCSDAEIAAKLCAELNSDGKDDWFLPSKDELNLMWINLADSDGDGYNLDFNPSNNLGGFKSGFYWSSTQVDYLRAWFQSFITGPQLKDGYTYTNFHVRAARAF